MLAGAACNRFLEKQTGHEDGFWAYLFIFSESCFSEQRKLRAFRCWNSSLFNWVKNAI